MINYQVDVDVAALPFQAEHVVREFMEKSMPHIRYMKNVPRAGTVKVEDPSGPGGGNPLVRCKFRTRKHAATFVALWYEVNDPDFIDDQIRMVASGEDRVRSTT